MLGFVPKPCIKKNNGFKRDFKKGMKDKKVVYYTRCQVQAALSKTRGI